MPRMPGAAVAVALVASERDEARSLSLRKAAAGCLSTKVDCSFDFPSLARREWDSWESLYASFSRLARMDLLRFDKRSLLIE
jgi:hypothetical protein